jgi:Bifunctional DNA primase/polymerase, N-terminal
MTSPSMVSIFSARAHHMLDMGYSPVPLTSDRMPLLKGWQRLRDKPLSPDQVGELSWYGLAVAGGYNGLVPIDIDTDDGVVLSAITTVLPKPNVAKRGSKGITGFYQSDRPIRGSKFVLPPPDAKPLVEILTTGNVTIPPTLHPKIGKPYRWLSERTLFDTPVSDLVAITPEHIDRLRDALSPWCPEREHAAVPTVDHGRMDSRRMADFAQARIRKECARLASTSSGRNWALFKAAATLGKFVHHGIVLEHEVSSALMAASRGNGYASKDGERAVEATIASGLAKARLDRLPDLDALRQSHQPRKQRVADALANRS